MSDKFICTHGEWPCNFFTRHNSEYTNESGLTTDYTEKFPPNLLRRCLDGKISAYPFEKDD
jgi:hypothetical protein